MRLTINKVEFDIEAIPEDLRAALLADPIVRQGLRREIMEWDHQAQSGRMLERTLDKGAIPLGNAMTFFVARKGPDGSVVNNPKLAQKAAEKFLKTVGAKNVLGVLRALAKVLPLPRIGLPRDRFRPIEKAASYKLVLETEFAVLRLHEASRNLSAYLFVPAQVSFRPEIGETDAAAWEALVAEKPELARLRMMSVLPEANAASRDVRRLATAQRLRDLQPRITAARDAGTPPDAATAEAYARSVREWRTLVPQDAN